MIILTIKYRPTSQYNLKSYKYTDSGTWKENAQRLNLSGVAEAVRPEARS